MVIHEINALCWIQYGSVSPLKHAGCAQRRCTGHAMERMCEPVRRSASSFNLRLPVSTVRTRYGATGNGCWFAWHSCLQPEMAEMSCKAELCVVNAVHSLVRIVQCVTMANRQYYTLSCNGRSV